MNQVFTIIAENAFGSSSAEWQLLVGETPLPGLEGHYYRLDKDESACQQRFYDYLMDLYTIRNDLDINHPFEHPNGYWEGIPSPMFYYGSHVEWNGYLDIKEEGEWQFQTQHIDGLKILIDDNTLINSYSCSDSISYLTRAISLTKGYHKIQILWFSSHKDFMLVIKVKRPSDSEFISIPEDLFVHAPSSVLSMTTQVNQFYVRRPISTISPLTFAIEDPFTSYSITPELPSGLIFSNGRISGTPSIEFGPTVFEIQAISNGKQYTTKCTYASYSVDDPGNVVVTDGINNITSVKWDIYKQIDRLTLSCDYPFCKLDITPALPEGIKYDSNNHEISGSPTQAMERTVFTITASTEASTTTKELTIEVPICEYGHYYYIEGSMYSGAFDLYIYKGEELVESHESVKLDGISLVLCIEPYNYNIAIRPNPFKQSISSISLKRDDGMTFFDTKVNENSWFNTTWQMIQTEAPQLNIEITEYYVRSTEELLIPYKIIGLSRPLMVDSMYVDDVTIREIVRSVEIKINQSGKLEYTFIVENDAGRNEVKITVWSDECPENLFLIQCFGTYYYYSDSIILTRVSDGKKVISRSLITSSTNPFYFCIENVPYYLTLSRKTSSDEKNFIILKNQQGRYLGSMELVNNLHKTELFQLVSLVQENSPRKAWVSSSSVNRKWNEIGYNEKKWIADSRDLGSFSSKMLTVYFRYHLNMNKMSIPALLLDVKANGGFIMYLNGHEVIRMNLPLGEISSKEMARRHIDLSQWTRVNVNAEWLEEGDNVISIELHCYSTGQPELEKILFELNQEQFTGSSYFFSDSGYASGTDHGVTGSSNPDDVFFSTNNYRYWEDVELPAQLRLTFLNNEPRLVNRMVMRSSYDALYQPIRFEVFGVINQTIYDGKEYSFEEVKESVLVVNNPYILDYKFKDETFYINPSRPYSAYEINVHATNTGTQTVRINKIWFYYDHHYFCPEEDDWPRTRGGDSVFGKCSIWKIGQSTRVCNTTGEWLDTDKDTCLTRWAGKTSAFLDAAYRIDNCTLEIYYNNTEAAFREVLVREMTVKEENVLLYLPRRCEAEGELPAVCVNVRLEPHRLTSQYVKMELDLFNTNITGLFYKKEIPSVPQHMTISLIEKVKLREMITGKDLILTVVIAILLVLCIVLFVLYYKAKNGSRNSKRKQLSKKSRQLDVLKPLTADNSV